VGTAGYSLLDLSFGNGRWHSRWRFLIRLHGSVYLEQADQPAHYAFARTARQVGGIQLRPVACSGSEEPLGKYKIFTSSDAENWTQSLPEDAGHQLWPTEVLPGSCSCHFLSRQSWICSTGVAST
jgi:hypothetical protein